MSTALSTAPRRSALVAMAARLNVEESSLLKTLKETVCKGCSDAELIAFSVVANEYNLNPFIKEIYAFPAKGGGLIPVISIDGWISMVNDHPQMDGMEFEMNANEKGDLESCTCTIFRKDRSRPIIVTEYLSECRRPTEPWKMEHRMLRHKSLMQCARYAFGFSGVTDEDEAEDMRDVTPREEKKAAPRVVRGGEPTEAVETKAEPATSKPESKQEEAPAFPARGVMSTEIRNAFKAAGLTLPQAEKVARDAGFLKAEGFSATDDEELFAISQNLGIFAKEEDASAEDALQPFTAWVEAVDMPKSEKGPATLTYSSKDQPERKAITWSKSLIALLETLSVDEEVTITIDTQSKGNDLLKSLELAKVEGGEA